MDGRDQCELMNNIYSLLIYGPSYVSWCVSISLWVICHVEQYKPWVICKIDEGHIEMTICKPMYTHACISPQLYLLGSLEVRMPSQKQWAPSTQPVVSKHEFATKGDQSTLENEWPHAGIEHELGVSFGARNSGGAQKMSWPWQENSRVSLKRLWCGLALKCPPKITC